MIAGATSSGRATPERSTHTGASAKQDRAPSAAAIASRVLPTPPGAGQRQQPGATVGADAIDNLRAVAVAADHQCGRRRDAGGGGLHTRRSRRARSVDRRRGREYGVLQSRQRVAWLEAELLGQTLARPLVDVKRVGSPAASVQRAHQLVGQPLARRRGDHEDLELGHDLCMPTELKVGLDAPLEREPAKLVETADLGLREILERDIGQRRAAPQRQRGRELVAAARPVASP
jgi:hypothetical protein